MQRKVCIMNREQYIELRHYLRDIIQDTAWENHVFMVGGCVRDDLMQNEIKDIDICVDIPNGGIRFAEWLYNNGLTENKYVTYPIYCTSMFRLKRFPEVELECVQTRKGINSDEKHRNTEVVFGSIAEDCFLRDLTINALYVNVSTDELLDITGNGIADINGHVIRTSTDPDVIFTDDPLRILRCIRFASRYGWGINQDTLDGILKNVHKLSGIAHERIRDEFNKMLTCDNPVLAMKLLRNTGAMHYVIPEMEQTYDMSQNHYHFGTVWEHTMSVLHKMESSDLHLRMSALLHDIGKVRTRVVSEDGKIHFIGHDTASAEMVEGILRYLKYPTDFIRNVQFLVKYHMCAKAWGNDLSQMKNKHLRKLQYICKTEDRFDELLLLIDADNKSHAEAYCMNDQVQQIRQRSEQMKENGTALFNYKLPFTGDEIMKLKGLKSGLEVKECLEYLLKLAYVNPLREHEIWLKCLIGYKLCKHDKF